MQKYWDFIFTLILTGIKIAILRYWSIANVNIIMLTSFINLISCSLIALNCWLRSNNKSFYKSICAITSVIVLLSCCHDIILLVAIYFGEMYIFPCILLMIVILPFPIYYKIRISKNITSNDTSTKNYLSYFLIVVDYVLIIVSIFVMIFFVYALAPISIMALILSFALKSMFQSDTNSTNDNNTYVKPRDSYESRMKCACGYCEGFWNKQSCNIEETSRILSETWGPGRNRAQTRYHSACRGDSYDDLG
ncbi:hypothetical protein QLL95_gp0243 [Cotonvirus japonicus]|uniref:Uncharacterized protein n=1 Tax=Cotonvirus japonicus TaxID=2811091 RepID=A0ABM7NRE1_9VIRU|nr:hypothetical protein QLL95_gp0243 [Cotonvirus japonicus]BCS82732.1 hypothetical protein [Cotonvirus japonicus]